SASFPFPIVLGVSERAHFGSSCSVMGATGGFVVGGAWAHAPAGNSTAIVNPKMPTRRTIACSLPRMRHPDNGLARVRVPLGGLRSIGHTPEADERKMAERWHRPVLDQAYST